MALQGLVEPPVLGEYVGTSLGQAVSPAWHVALVEGESPCSQPHLWGADFGDSMIQAPGVFPHVSL